jgi:hypothetical protein
MVGEISGTVLSAGYMTTRKGGESLGAAMRQHSDSELTESELELLGMEAVIALWKGTRKCGLVAETWVRSTLAP